MDPLHLQCVFLYLVNPDTLPFDLLKLMLLLAVNLLIELSLVREELL